MEFKTIIEPFRIKSTEPVRQTTTEQREAALIAANYNLFLLKSEDVIIDLLTDSGTGAMSTAQWSGMMRGDESYAGSKSYYHFEQTVRDITGFKYVLPTHQGRAAERILFSNLLSSGDVVPNNTHFDTIHANAEFSGAVALDASVSESHQPDKEYPFKGNMDLVTLEERLKSEKDKIPLVILTVTNSSGGGQPVSMANIRATSKLCRFYQVPFFLDACRFAENTWFIKTREPGYADKTPLQIAQEMFSYADGCTMSAKKGGMANIGGLLALNDPQLMRSCQNTLILTEGFPTYGGLAGYDLEAIAIGLQEALEEDYLKYRIRSVAYFGDMLNNMNIPTIRPTGGHAVYVDAKAMLPHIPQSQYPAWSLSLALYLLGGVRSVEIGSVKLGLQPDGSEKVMPLELLRMSFPRRTYTQSHVDYVGEVWQQLVEIKDRIAGMQMIEYPRALRHYTAKLVPVGGKLIR